MEKINVINGLKKNYVIPCFQREYSWGVEEIEELIKNLKNIKHKDDYCIGVITVQKKKDYSLLIDGQQRLTTLYLLAIYCGIINEPDDIYLKFEYEELTSGKNDLINLLSDKENGPQNLINGYRIISKEIKKDEIEGIKKVLKGVYYYQIDLDDNIDLNHYFEVMNSRGIQLSRSDIIKSYLMNKLKKNEDDQFRLNQIWYRYEIMDNSRKSFKNFEQISIKMKSNYKSINKILSPDENTDIDFKNDESDTHDNNDNSILNFDYFLLYVIRLYKNIDSDEDTLVGEFNLNDLIKEYEDTFNNKDEKEVIKFINFMIKMKNNYDKYIVKFDNSSETWSLEVNNRNTLLLQSCLRVSFVNRRLMHWIYFTLKYFYKYSDVKTYNKRLRNYIRERYIKDFLNETKKNGYYTGFDTPVIVLNYLDLLIKENFSYLKNEIPMLNELKPDEFTFKFRNSIEHFKPRHDKDGNENPKWVDDFGNLALLAYGTNTKMQNAEPDEKAKHFKKDLSGYSLKLQIMTLFASNQKWEDKESFKVRDLMIKLLENDFKKMNE